MIIYITYYNSQNYAKISSKHSNNVSKYEAILTRLFSVLI